MYYKNAEFSKSIIIVERMANQNTFDEVAQDYKYWEDASDELGDRKCKRYYNESWNPVASLEIQL